MRNFETRIKKLQSGIQRNKGDICEVCNRTGGKLYSVVIKGQEPLYCHICGAGRIGLLAPVPITEKEWLALVHGA